MSKSKRFLLAGCILVVLAAIFVVYAIFNPQGSFPWSNTITYLIYFVYGAVTVLMFVLAKKYKRNVR